MIKKDKLLSLWSNNKLSIPKSSLSLTDNDKQILSYWAGKVWIQVNNKKCWWVKNWCDILHQWYIWVKTKYEKLTDNKQLFYINFLDKAWNYLLNTWELWFIKEWWINNTTVKIITWWGLNSWNLWKGIDLLKNRLKWQWFQQKDENIFFYYFDEIFEENKNLPQRTFMFNKRYEHVEWPFLWKYYKVCRKKWDKIEDLDDVMRRIDSRAWWEWNVCDRNWNLLFNEWYWEIQICPNWYMIVWCDYDEYNEGWYNIVDNNWNFILDERTYNVKYVWDWFFKIENHDFVMDNKDLFLKNNKVGKLVSNADYDKYICEIFDDGSDYSDIIFFLVDGRWNVNFSTLYSDISEFSEWYAMVEFPWLWYNFIDHDWNLLF